MYVAYNRFYPPELAHFEKRNASPDRSHNETLDALVTTGWFGLAAYLFLSTSIFYFGLKWLGLIRKRWQKLTFVGLWVAGGVLGAIGTWAWRGPAYIGVGIPIGAMVGLAIYVFVSLLSATFRPESSQVADGRYHLWILALLSAIVAHFVEIQFGIAIAATRTYFWVFAATMVVIGARLALQPVEPRPTSAETEVVPEDPQTSARRRRRRGATPVPQARSKPAHGSDWIGSLLTLSLMAILFLGTMLFNWITPQLDNPGLLSTIWESLTQSKEQPSVVILALLLFIWMMIGLVGLSDLATRKE
jgi:hypothetical protein